MNDIVALRRWKHLDAHDPAEGYLALSNLGVSPRDDSPYTNGRPWWWQVWGPDTTPESVPGPHTLPIDWWRLIPWVTADYATKKEAEREAAIAFARLPADRRRELLATLYTPAAS